MNAGTKMRALMISASLCVTVMLTAAVMAAPPKKSPGKKAPGKKTEGKALVAAGLKVYEKNGCANCHAIKGKGGKIASDLTKVGAKRNAKWLEKVVVNPKSVQPKSTMPAYKDSIKGNDLKSLVAYLGSLKK